MPANASAWIARGRRADVLVLALALAVRLVALIDGMDAPTFDYPVVDAATYDQAARALAEGRGLDWRFFWQPILYPVLLALSHGLSGGSILFAKVVQLLVGVATCWLVLRVGRRLLGAGTGLLAGLFCALHGPMILFETELLATGLAAFWAALLLDRFTLLGPGTSRRGWLLTGLIAAVAVLTRPTFLPCVVVAALVVLWPDRGRFVPGRGGLFAAGLALPLVCVAILGATVANHPGFLPASGAMNLYLGNHDSPCETLTIRPGEGWKELVGRATPSTEGDLVANREFFTDELLETLRNHPGAVVRGMGRKALQMVSSRELPRNVDPYVQAEWSTTLQALMPRFGGFGLPMGLLIPLAGIGWWSTRRRLPVVFTAFTFTYALAVVAVFVSARYRIPLVPAISVFAAAGLVELVGALRVRRLRRATACLFAGVVLAVATAAPGPFCEEQVNYRAEMLYAVAYAQHSAGDREGAAKSYAAALQERPDYVEALNQFALLRSQQKRTEEAIALWTRAAELQPDHLAARLNLGRVHAERQEHFEALEQYEAALQIRESNPDALLGSGFALLGMARFEEGVERFERALAIDPRLFSKMPVVIEALRSTGRAELAQRLGEVARRARGRH